ncbi:MAG: methyl-accepting chemotaxis protein [Helicobacteraceae bacterium]|jgi:methyl-accepting chemotaxis protein|nr:methyl-accepting chemotaxis protein [Helicobacteraceae bacterium]
MIRQISVGKRLVILALVGLISIAAVGIFGYFGVKSMDEQAEHMYSAAALPATELGAMNGALGKIVADLLLAFQHDPNSRFAKTHDHPVMIHIDSAEDWRKRFDGGWERYKKTERNAEELKMSETIETHYKAFINDTYTPLVDQLKNGIYTEEGNIKLIQGFRAHAEIVEHSVADLIALQEDIAENMNIATTNTYSQTSIRMIVVTCVSLALLGVIAFLIATSITEPLDRIQAMTGEIEQTGDFTKRIQVRAEDEVGTTARIINHLLDSLQTTFASLLKNTEHLDKASAELAELSGRVAKASEKTSDSSSDMAASVEEMTASITQVGENAKETSKNADQMMNLSKSGTSVVLKTVEEMRQMADAVESSSETISELGKQSEQISGIVQTIKDIADQTNLLALNAAIEAARAGEQGRGFAVVADEIRKLAERTTSATTEIAAMISAIQESSHSAVSSMTHAADRVNTGVSLASEAGNAINDIQKGAEQVQVRVDDITSALNEQSTASHQIAEHVERVAQATDENSEVAKKSFQAADNIASLARSMRDTMSRFKV